MSILIGLSDTFAIAEGILFPKLAGASKTMTPSSVTRNADCHPLSEITYTPPPKFFTAYPTAGSIFQNFAFTEGKTGTYSFKDSCDVWAETWPPQAAASSNANINFVILTSPCD